MVLKLVVSKKTGSGYNVLPFKIEKPICAFFAEDQYFYEDMVKFSTVPEKMPCPIPVVKTSRSLTKTKIYFVLYFQEAFDFNGWQPSLEKLPPMLAKNGDYKVNLAFVAETMEIFALVGYVSVINIYF